MNAEYIHCLNNQKYASHFIMKQKMLAYLAVKIHKEWQEEKKICKNLKAHKQVAITIL